MTSFLIGTHSFLLHVNLVGDDSLKKLSTLNNGHHYGISCPAHEPNVFYSKNKDGYFNKYDCRTLRMLGQVSFGDDVGHVHQCIKTEKGIYLTDTLHNRLMFISNKGRRSEYYINGLKEDVNHLNSIFICGEQLVLLLNNKSDLSEVYILNHLCKDKFELWETIKLNHRGCHNVYIENNYLYYNASEDGLFVRLNLIDQTQECIEFGGHTKGLSVTLKNFIIGVSEYAQQNERYHTNGSIAIIDKAQFKTKSIVPLQLGKESVGNINEIRCISEYDYSMVYPQNLNLFNNKRNQIEIMSIKKIQKTWNRLRSVLDNN
ncbi:MAG: hypothetical protein RIG77_11590 [Cyclobacteriaceae bacterium]